MKTELEKRCAGDVLTENLIEAARMTLQRQTIGCFTAGTLVHTKDGLKAIQNIQVGDYVLSRPESGEGAVAYKRVSKTFRFEQKEVWYLAYIAFGKDHSFSPDPGVETVVATANHPFWVVGLASAGEPSGYREYSQPQWKAVEQLEPDEIVVFGNGSLGKIAGLAPIYKTLALDIGWHQAKYMGEPWDGDGHVVRFDEDCTRAEVFFRTKSIYNDEALNDSGDYVPYEATVYNLEVEDFHTYFIGQMGVWVHNTDCSAREVGSTKLLDTNVTDAVKNKLSPTTVPNVFQSPAAFAKSLPATKKAIGAFKEADVNKWWSELQYRFDGSLSVFANGVRTLYAYGLGFNNPFGGRSVNAMGDALAHIYKGDNRVRRGRRGGPDS